MTPDYYVLWGRLERKLLDLRQGMADSLCVAPELEKVKVLQGGWGAYGHAVNIMRELVEESRSGPNKPEAS